VIDIDGMLVDSHSDKDEAAPTHTALLSKCVDEPTRADAST
jgi:hypothetical protein